MSFISKILALLMVVPNLLAQELRFEKLPELVQQEHPLIQAFDLEKQAAQQKEGYLLRSFLPELQFYGAQENFKKGHEDYKQQPTFGAELKVNLFNGGRDQLESQRRKLLSEKKSAQSTRVFFEELQKSRELFWQISYSKEKILLLQDLLSLNKKNLVAAEKRIRGGLATESDRMEFQMKAVDLERDLAEEQIKIQAAQREWSVLFPNLPLELQTISAKLEHDHEYEKKLQHDEKDHDFLYREYELEAEALSLGAKSESRSWWPTLEAYAAYNQHNQLEEDYPRAADRAETVLGLRVSIKFSAGLESQVHASALKKESRSEELKALYMKKQTRRHLENEKAELSYLHEQIHFAQENIKRAEQYYNLTQSEYARGVKNSPDVLGASEKIYEARQKYLQILRDFQIAKSHIMSKSGH